MYATVSYTGNGVTTLYALPFNYISQSDISVTVGGVSTSAFTFPDASHIQFSVAPSNGAAITITRGTAITLPDVVFQDGSTLRGGDLNTAVNQTLYGLQELNDLLALSRTQTGNLPVVTSTNNGQTLIVVGGVWTAELQPVADTSLTTAAAGLSVHLGDTSLVVSSGLKVQLLTNGGLQTVAGGVQVLGRDTSLTIGGLGVGVNLVANGGLNIASGVYVRGMQVISADVGSPVDGDTWYNSTSFVFKQRLHGQTITYGGLLFINGPGSAVVNTTTLTAASSGTLNANFLAGAKVLRVRATILYNNTATPTLAVGLYANGTSNNLNNLTLPITSGTSGAIEVEFLVRVTAAGTSGTADCMAHWHLSQAGAADHTRQAETYQTQRPPQG